jgi:dihydroorotate dehydrogenase electron transfer subunit
MAQAFSALAACGPRASDAVMIQRMPAADRDAILVARQTLSDSYFLLTFRHPEVAHNARAGQFVMVKAGSVAELPLRRPFSIMDVDPQRETFRLYIKIVGAQTASLATLSCGATARCLGPLGRPFSLPDRSSRPLLVAGGFGIAPFRLLCVELSRAGIGPHVFYGGRTSSDLTFLPEMRELNVPLTISTEDGTTGFHGRITDALEEYLSTNASGSTLYACGPRPMLTAVAGIAAQKRLPAQISLDSWMGCGLGTCLGCVVRIQKAGESEPHYRCTCTEGPVFDSAEVLWRGDTESRARAEEASP